MGFLKWIVWFYLILLGDGVGSCSEESVMDGVKRFIEDRFRFGVCYGRNCKEHPFRFLFFLKKISYFMIFHL